MQYTEAGDAYLWKEQLPGAKHVTDNIHAVHEWLLDDHERFRHLGQQPGLLRILQQPLASSPPLRFTARSGCIMYWLPSTVGDTKMPYMFDLQCSTHKRHAIRTAQPRQRQRQ